MLAEAEGHGYEIAQRLSALRQFSSEPADLSGIYRALGRMEREGYVTSRWETPASGPARKVFGVTPAGLACLHQWGHTLRAYREGIDELLDVVARVA